MTWGVGARKPPAPSTRVYKVLLSFHYSQNGWRCSFFMDDSRRTALPRRAFIRTDEELMEFIRRSGGIDGSDTRYRYYVEQAITRGHGEVTLRLNEVQYQALHTVRRKQLEA